MKDKDLKNQLISLRNILRETLLLVPSFQMGEEKTKFINLFNRSCKLVFDGNFYINIWDEGILLQLEKLFQIKTPDREVYGEELRSLAERTNVVHQINDLFFSILCSEVSIDDLCKILSNLIEVNDSLPLKLQASNHLEEVRSSKASASEKIESFIDHLEQDIGVDLNKIRDALKHTISSLKDKEASGRVNALLVSTTNNAGIVVPLQIRLQDGKGEVKPLVPGREDFKMAIKRAAQDLIGRRFLSDAYNVLYSLDITEADYSGDSIGLPAAIAMCAAINKEPIDPYTAFTGNINLEGEQFKIKAVKGILEKLDAAILNGCRRIFIPKENNADVTEEHQKKLQIHYVDDITAVLLKLQKSLEPLPGDSLQIRKINRVRACCLDRGWYLSGQKPIQDGIQLTIAPLNPPELKMPNPVTSNT